MLLFMMLMLAPVSMRNFSFPILLLIIIYGNLLLEVPRLVAENFPLLRYYTLVFHYYYHFVDNLVIGFGKLV